MALLDFPSRFPSPAGRPLPLVKFPVERDNKDIGSLPRHAHAFRGRSDVSLLSRPQHHPPPLLPRLRRRRRQDRPRLAADRRRSPAAHRPPPAIEPAGPRSRRTSRRRRSASFTCSWPAPRASSTCSTTSRSWRELEGKPIPPSVIGGQRYAFIRSDAAVLGPRFKFTKHGQCGAELSEMLPHLAERGRRHLPRQVDAHRPVQPRPGADLLQHRLLPAGPAEHRLVGDSTAWAARRSDLPAFVVMSTGGGISGGAANWSSGFLPTVYAGVRFRNQGDPILERRQPRRRRRQAAARLARPDRRRSTAAASTDDRRSGDRHAHRLLRDGLPPANLGPRVDGPHERDARRRWTCTAATRPSRRSPGPACWPGGWSSAACASSTSTTRAGTPTPTWPATSRNNCGKTDRASRGAGART